MIRKLRVYSSSSNKKKFKIQKILAIGFTTGMMLCLSGCGKKDEPSFIKPIQIQTEFNLDTSSSYTNSIKENKEVYKAPNIEYGMLEFDNITYSDDANIYFQDYLSKINTSYHYSEIFNTEKALDLYEAESDLKVNHSHDFLNGSEQVDIDKLYDVVIKNNNKYLKENKIALYKELPNDEVKKILNIVADTLNSYIKKYPDIDLDSLSCILGDLKVLSKNTASNAFISEDGVLGVNKNMLEIFSKQWALKGIDAYKNTIKHETIHLLQKVCKDEVKKQESKSIGISREYSSLDMNPLFLNWLYEAAAEKNVVHSTGDEPIVYTTMITYLDSLNLATFLNDKNGVKQAEELDFYKDLDNLFEMFDITTKEEKIELINMMTCINIIQVEPSDFVKKFKETYGKDFNEDSVLSEVKRTIKAEVMQTLTKYFYRNLANQIVNKELTLEDVFYLITTFENDINLHIKYTDSEYNYYNENFIRYYVELQNEFFYSLTLNNNYTLDDVKDEFDSYHTKAYNEDNVLKNNYSLTWLNDEESRYIKNYYNSVSSDNHETIQDNLKRVYSESFQYKK